MIPRARAVIGRLVCGGILILLPVSAAAQGLVPANPETTLGMLAKEPMTAVNWPRWRSRLRSWIDSEGPNTAPAFEAARQFLKEQARKQDQLPPPLAQDAFAWLLLGDAYFPERRALPSEGTLPLAEKALQRSLALDNQSARAHYYLSRVILWQELDPRNGPTYQPNIHRLEEGRKQQELARKLDPSIPALSAREEANLAFRTNDFPAAEQFLRQALREQPGEAQLAHRLAQSVVYQKVRAEPRAPAIRPLTELFPQDGYLASFHGFALAQDNDLKGAVREFDRARTLGTDPTHVLPASQIHKIEDKVRPSFFERLAWVVGAFTLFYGTVMLLMAGAGLMLARWTHGRHALGLLGRPADQLVTQSQVVQTQHESWLNRFYGFALLVVLVLFYASIPFIVTGLLSITLILLCLTFFMNRDPDISKLHGNLLRASSGGTWAVLKSLFTGFGSGGFGIRKTAEQCPRLYKTLEEVAERIDTEPVDEVYLAPGSDIGVHQEGRGPFGLFGSKRRVLTLGVSILPFLTISELKSILAHEYAHFSHHDTFYNRFIAQVSLSMALTRRGMAESGGWVTWVNPFYWFFYLYARSYSLLSSGFSRSREYLADRMACSLYGAEVFSSALGKVITEGTLFDVVMYPNIIDRLCKRKAFINMYHEYRMFRVKDLTEPERHKLRTRLLDEKGSLFASHPTYEERVAAVATLPKANKKDPTTALQLFDNPAEIEKELTDFLTDYINSRIRIIEV